MSLHDNTKHIMLTFHTLKGRWYKYLLYLNDFTTVSLRVIMFEWGQKLNGVKHSCISVFCVQVPKPGYRDHCVRSSSIY